MSAFGERVFVLANLRDGEGEGRGPDVPRSLGFEEIGTAHPHAGWRLYALFPRARVEGIDWPGVDVIPEPLQGILRRADRRAGALGRLRRDLLAEFAGAAPAQVGRGEFLRITKYLAEEALEAADEPPEFSIEPMGIDDVW